MRKKLLSTITALFGIMALVATCTPFIMSLKPAANSGENLPRIDIANMAANSIKHYDNSAQSPLGQRYIIYKNNENLITVFTVPIEQGKVLMPDLKWGRRGASCNNFNPTLKGVKVVENSHFRCQSNEESEWWRKENRWDLTGKNLGQMTEDISTIQYSLEGKYLVPRKY